MDTAKKSRGHSLPIPTSVDWFAEGFGGGERNEFLDGLHVGGLV